VWSFAACVLGRAGQIPVIGAATVPTNFLEHKGVHAVCRTRPAQYAPDFVLQVTELPKDEKGNGMRGELEHIAIVARCAQSTLRQRN
jgi:hypothetical protein